MTTTITAPMQSATVTTTFVPGRVNQNLSMGIPRKGGLLLGVSVFSSCWDHGHGHVHLLL
jgi:hypothetical protein